MKKILFTTLALFTFLMLLAPIAAETVTTTQASEPASGFAVFASLCFTLLFCGIYLAIPLCVVGGYAISLLLIIDVFRRDFGEKENEKILWVIILLIAGFPIGVVLYYILVMRKYPVKK